MCSCRVDFVSRFVVPGSEARRQWVSSASEGSPSRRLGTWSTLLSVAKMTVQMTRSFFRSLMIMYRETLIQPHLNQIIWLL